jgi:hypothetical protein
MDRKLLKEAIADAKAVKETAIANAKAALEEAFTPQLKSMFAAKIQEMELEEDNMEEAYDMDNMEEAYDMENMEETYDMENMEEEMDSKDLDEVEIDEEELNLDELLAELEGLDEEESTEESLNEAEGDEEESEEEEMSDEDMEAETLDLENMTDEDLKKFIEGVITDMVQAGELEAGESMEDESEEMEDEEVDLDELMAEAYHGKDMKTEAKKRAKKDEDQDEMKEELEEAYATIQKLTQDINEINLLNAKLLYTNKIFKASALTESQKVKVLSSMDKATNVKEVKLVYESLSENLKPKKAPIKENLNFASKSAGVAPKVSQSNPILDPTMVARFKKIAGI